jgi:hypothetical protein
VSPAYVGQTLEFGGPEPLSFDMVAATLARARLADPWSTFAWTMLRSRLGQSTQACPDFVVEAITVTGSSARQGK